MRHTEYEGQQFSENYLSKEILENYYKNRTGRLNASIKRCEKVSKIAFYGTTVSIVAAFVLFGLGLTNALIGGVPGIFLNVATLGNLGATGLVGGASFLVMKGSNAYKGMKTGILDVFDKFQARLATLEQKTDTIEHQNNMSKASEIDIQEKQEVFSSELSEDNFELNTPSPFTCETAEHPARQLSLKYSSPRKNATD